MDPQFFQPLEIPEQSKLNQKPFPVAYQPTREFNFVQLQHYFQNHQKQIIDHLNKEGALYFRGFDIQSPNEMASILNKLGLDSFEYIGGAAVRKLIVGSPNRKTDSIQLFTTNQSPPKEPIPFHNQLMQNANYPQYLSFYCYSEAQEGGSTPLVNCVEIYKYIQNKHPDFLKKLKQLGVRYIRVVGEEDNPKSPIGRGWKNIFKASDKKVAQQKIKENDYEFEWLNNADNDCKLISKKLPAVRVSKSGQNVFCNQMIAVFKGWVDQKNSPSKCLKFGDFSDLPTQILEDISNFADKNKAAIPWKVGDFVLIDNEMAKHSRQPFVGRHRKIYASLLKGTKKTKDQCHLVLNSGDEMPIMGFGTWKIPKEVCPDIVYNTLKNGYKLLDCACDYGNQAQVGLGIKKALDQKLLKRQQLFVTSKLWNNFHRPQHVKQACLKTLKDLGLQYLDLYLMHFPISLQYIPFQQKYPPGWIHDQKAKNPSMEEDFVPLIDTWRAMEALVEEGLVRNIGICNFTTALLRDLMNNAKIPPAVLQVELHPYLTQKKLVRYCRSNRIQMTGFSSFGGASYIQLSMATKEDSLFDVQIVKKCSAKYKKTPGQILLRWAVQQGIAVIPKTSQVPRLKENADVFDWNLSPEEMKEIDNLNLGKRYNDPGVFCEKAFGKFFPIYD